MRLFKFLVLIQIILLLILITLILIKKNRMKKNEETKEILEIEQDLNELKRLEEEKYFNNKELPKSYFQDEIVLMPKNADCIFAYWEISQDTHEKLNQEEYLIKLEGSEELNIPIKDRNSSMFISNLNTNGRYIAKLGYFNQGNFEIIAQSKEVTTASNKESDDLSTIFAKTTRLENNNKVKIIFEYIKDEKYTRLESQGVDENEEYLGSSK